MSTRDDVARALPDYDIEGSVGAGGHGRVWSGRHRDLDRAVAVKQLVGAAPADVARFRREARLMARVDHPHVVRVFDYREVGELRLLVMELLTGGTLKERAVAGIGIEDAVAATMAASYGLHVVHQCGILHRDVKPENLLFDGRGILKVGDFGIASADSLQATWTDRPVTGALVGTPAYLSPEQAGAALGGPPLEVDARSDQYSLAATLFTLLTGRLTHDGRGGALALCRRRVQEDAPSVRAFAPSVPAEVDAVVSRALARDPEGRYESCREFADALFDACRALGPSWDEVSLLQIQEPGVAGSGRGANGSSTFPDDDGPIVVTLPPRLRREGDARFAGRAHEQQRWRDTWKVARAGDTRAWLIGGEAGVGKSALAAWIARQAQDDGAVVLYGRCVDDLGTPYQPWIEVLTPIVTEAPSALVQEHIAARGGELARLVPPLTSRTGVVPPVVTDAESERYALFGAVVDLLTRVSKRAPVVVVVEDLHWADKPTIQLLRHVITAAEPTPLAIVATYRPTDVTATHPLAEAFGPLRREPNVEFLDVRGLDDLELLELMEGVAGHPMDADGVALRDAIAAETNGNPFFTLEILRHLSESGAIERSEGRWTATTDLAALGLPVSVRQVVGERVARLGADTQRLLSTAAVVGREFELRLVADVADVDEDDALDLLDAAVDAALVHNVGPDRYTFAHALVGRTLYEGLSPSRRGRVHRRIAMSLEKRPGDDNAAAQLAHHWASALVPDDALKAIDSAHRAGEHALDQLAPEEAVRWFDKALALHQAHGSNELTATRILVGLGTAQRQVNDPAHRATLLDAASRARRLGDRDLLVAAALANGRGWASSTGGVDLERVEVIEAALDVVGPADHADRVRLLARLVAELTFDDDIERRRAAADEAEAMARRLQDERALLAALVGLLTLPVRPGGDGLRWGDEAIELATALDDPVSLALAAGSAATHALVHADRPRFDRAVAVCEGAAARVVDPVLTWRGVGARALQAVVDGELDRAEELVSAVLPDDVDPTIALFWYGSLVMTIRAHQGRGGEIRDLVAMIAADPMGGSAAELAKPALILADLQAGDDAAAREILTDQAGRGFASPEDSLRITHVCFNATGCARLALRQHADTLVGLLRPYVGMIAAGPSICLFTPGACAAALEALLGNPDEADRLFSSTIEVTSRFGAPYLVASAQLEWALALLARARAEPDRAHSLLVAALETARTHGYGEVELRSSEALDRLA